MDVVLGGKEELLFYIVSKINTELLYRVPANGTNINILAWRKQAFGLKKAFGLKDKCKVGESS